MIKHYPILNIKDIEKHYTEKDGVLIKYVCTSSINSGATFAYDIFYRNSPHPKFGNRYFGISVINKIAYITNADSIEGLDFYMIKDNNDDYHYSQHRHHCIDVDGFILDGGRAYCRTSAMSAKIELFKIKNGNFIQKN